MQEQGRTWYFTGEMCKSGEADKVEAIIFREVQGTKSESEEDAPFGLQPFCSGLRDYCSDEILMQVVWSPAVSFITLGCVCVSGCSNT